MLPATTAEAARRFADRIAYVSEAGWSLTYADLDRISDEVAVGLSRRGVAEGAVPALPQRHVVRAPRIHHQAAGCPAPRRHHVHHAAVARRRRARVAEP